MKKDTLENWKRKANLVHNNKYDYSLITEYHKSGEKVKIICPIHGLFIQRNNDHINKRYGCKLCGIINFSNNRKKGIKQFIKEANLVHNNKYDYSKFTYVNFETKGIIICPAHGSFLQTPHHHLNGEGCPRCNSSHGERIIRNYLIKNNILFEEQKTFDTLINDKTGKKLLFDFYLPNKKIVIEFQGEQHYKERGYIIYKDFKNNLYRDNLKRKWCLNNNIKEIEISYKEIKKIDKILKEVI